MKNWILTKLFPDYARQLAAAEREAEGERQGRLKAAERWAVQLNRVVELESELAGHRARRNVAWPRPARRIPRPQILAAFAEPVDAGLPAALHQEIDDYLQELLDQVSQPPSSTMPETMRLHLAGGIEHVRLLQKTLLDLHAEASKADAELEEKEGAN